jgi:hypothetical protein
MQMQQQASAYLETESVSSRLRHINDSVLSSLKMEGIRFYLYLYVVLTRRTTGRILGTFQKAIFNFRKSENIGKKKYGRTPPIRTLVIRIANYPNWIIGPSG